MGERSSSSAQSVGTPRSTAVQAKSNHAVARANPQHCADIIQTESIASQQRTN